MADQLTPTWKFFTAIKPRDGLGRPVEGPA